MTKQTPITFDDLHDLDAPAKPAGSAPDAKTDLASQLSLGAGRSQATVARFPCGNCHGTGRWRGKYVCRVCKGVGKLKTDPNSKAQRKARDAVKVADRMIEWAKDHEPEMQWMKATADRFDFARAMLDAWTRYAELTAGQLAAVRKCMARDAAHAQQLAERKPDVDLGGAGFARMVAAFAAAKSAGLKWPKFHVAEYVFSIASETSKNAGHVYVKRGSAYLGKITGEGAYFATGDATEADRTQLADIGRDPLAAAVVHGKQTGRCSCCGRALENEESVQRGIGPICAQKWGLG